MNDTICAISTPPGIGGIAVIRLSGPQAFEIFAPLWKGKPVTDMATHTSHLGNIIDPLTDEILDQALITVFRAPKSYTGENTIEISVHGSKWIQEELIKLLLRHGARLAEHGEFTRRAFTSGNIDLTQAEAVADIIAARSRAAHRIASSQMRGSFSKRLTELRASLIELASLLELELDFSDQEVEFASRKKLRNITEEILCEIKRLCRSFDEGRAISDGIPVAIVGDTNAGKSTLLNRLVENDRAIVSDIRGTTRDTIEETAVIGDVLYRFIDTAGIRNTSDPIETLGIERSKKALKNARIVLWIIDSTDSPETVRDAYFRIFSSDAPVNDPVNTPVKIPVKSLVAVLNKTDINHDNNMDLSEFAPERVVKISASTGYNLSTLKDILSDIVDISLNDSDITITNLRHYNALSNAEKSLEEVLQGIDNQEYIEFVAQSLRDALRSLAEITGEITDNQILTSIFSSFCIGK